jgi:hypothetical protein
MAPKDEGALCADDVFLNDAVWTAFPSSVTCLRFKKVHDVFAACA